MKFGYVLFASLATTTVATPQRLRSLQYLDGLTKAGKEDGSMSMSGHHAAEENVDVVEEMSVTSKATKLFKPSPSKAGKELSMDAKAEKVISIDTFYEAEMSMKAKAIKEPVTKAPVMSVAAKTHKEDNFSMTFGNSTNAEKFKFSDAKAGKLEISALTKEAKAEKAYSLSMSKSEKSISMRF